MKTTKKRQKIRTVYIPLELDGRSEKHAKREGLTVSALHRLALLAYLGKAPVAKKVAKKPVKVALKVKEVASAA